MKARDYRTQGWGSMPELLGAKSGISVRTAHVLMHQTRPISANFCGGRAPAPPIRVCMLEHQHEAKCSLWQRFTEDNRYS